ncbi:MAG: hypothetical protein KDE22_17035 [Rhodobacterales bacterium]|nr:hypothetical protein [Rhodobacterales bacterium]
MRAVTFLILALVALSGAARAEIPHHDLTVVLDPAAGRVAVTDRITARGALRLPGLAVEVTQDGKPLFSHRLDLDGTHTVTYALEDALLKTGRDNPYASRIAADGTFLSLPWTPRLVGADTFSYRLTVTTPPGQKAVAPGRLDGEEDGPQGYRATFVSERPMTGLVLLAGPWQVAERRHKGILLRTYFDPSIGRLADDYLNSAAGYIDLYADWIAPYPFSAFHMVSGPAPVGLGFENLTYMGARVLALPFIRHSSLGHEVLHNWWGNGVDVAYDRGNWCEGLTTYMADHFYALRRDPARAREMRLGWLRDFAALPAGRDAPARAFVSKTHDAAQVVGYHKVAFVFHMLRGLIGAPAFDAGLQALWQAKKFQVADWEDLRRAFEGAAGRDLSPFFAQWLDRPGAPRLTLSDVAASRDGAGYRIDLTLGQDAPAYALSVPVAVETEAGMERVVLPLDGATARHAVTVAARPLRLTVDPDLDLFRRLDPSETPPILRDVTLADGAGVVITTGNDRDALDAARALAGRLLDRPGVKPAPGRPLLVIGTTDAVAAALRDSGLPPVPESLDGQGTARAWAGRADGRSYVVVAADSAQALADLMRPLPHYKRQGWLVFDGATATARGAWPAGPGPLRVDLTAP